MKPFRFQAEYMGIDPVPQDFSAFWSLRIQEADAVPLSYVISPSEIPAYPLCSFQDLWFKGMDGADVYAKFLLPKSDRPVPLMLQFHGYPGASRSWLEQASWLGMGFAVLAMDCPGQNGHGTDPGGRIGSSASDHFTYGLEGPVEKMYYTQLYQNIRILCRIAESLPGIDRHRIYVNGGSQGGALAIACAALNPERIRRAAILYPYLSDFLGVWERQECTPVFGGLWNYSRWFDPDGSNQDQWFGKLAYIDSKNLASLIQCPVLFGISMADQVCPPMTQNAAFNQLRCPKELHLYPGFDHDEIQDFDDLTLDFFGKDGDDR